MMFGMLGVLNTFPTYNIFNPGMDLSGHNPTVN